jgi:hypothetical protein
LESPVESQLLRVLGLGLSVNEDVAMILADVQVPDAAVGRLTNPGLDLFGQRYHRRLSFEIIC